jgi:hypothetical protein
MPKNKVSEWSPTAANNTDIGGINIAEGCAPSGINNAIREMMAQVKDMQAGTDSDGLVVGGAFTCSGAAVFSSTIIANGVSTFSNNVILGDASTDAHSLNGAIALQTDAKILLDDSVTTASLPPLAFDGDTNTGIYRPAADNISIATGGVEAVRVNSSGAVIVGTGEGTATVAGNTIRGVNAAGTNIVGSSLTIAAGTGTGTGGSGSIVFNTAPAGGSGTTANTSAQRLLITKNGGFSFGSGSTDYGSSGQVLKSNGDASPSFGSVITPKTAWVYSTNVTEIAFTDIPTWVKRVTIAISQLSANSTGNILLQVGDGSTYDTTGYIGSATTQAGSSTAMSTGFVIVNSSTAASVYSGIVTLVNLTGNTWCEQGMLALSAGGTRESAGVRVMSAALQSLRLYIDGTQLFDAGSVNVLYE